MESSWGNPSAKTFRKKHVRQVRMSTCAVLVHIELADLAADILRRAEAAGIQLPETLGGWISYVDGHDPREYGMAFRVPEEVLDLDLGPWLPLSLDGVPHLRFMGTVEEAQQKSLDLEEARVSILNPQLEKPSDAWQTCLPGTRELHAGCLGDDVQFVQYALNVPIQDGVWNLQTTEAVRLLQARYGQRQTGVMDETAWRALLPTAINHRIEFGDSGFVVRLLQAALLAYDWDDDVQVTGRFDQLTMRGVKALQDNYGIRPTGAMSGPEWAALLGRSVRNG